MKKDFRNKVVIIVGATGGIGRALSCRFAQAGARIVLIDLDANKLSGLKSQVERLGTQALDFVCDITNEDLCQEVMQTVVEQFGGIDVLINNAAIIHHSCFAETDINTFRKVMEVNYFGAIHCTQAALNSLKLRRGLIITISSSYGLIPAPELSGYSASKHALHGLFESLRLELKEHGVSVLMACPGATATDLHQKALTTSIPNNRPPHELIASIHKPQDVAANIFDAAENNKNILIMNRSNSVKMGWFSRKMWLKLFESRGLRQWLSERGND